MSSERKTNGPTRGVLSPPEIPDLLYFGPPDETAPILVSRQWPAKRRDIISRAMNLLGKFPDRGAPLEARVQSEQDRGKYLLQHVTYQVEPDEMCPAWLLLPKPAAHRQPAVLCCHQALAPAKDAPAGVGGGKDLPLAVELVTHGYVCLAPDCVACGERASADSPGYDTSAFYRRHPNWSALGKMIWDHQRGLDFLCSLDAVDSDRLAVIGHGFGGRNAIMLAAFDHRIKLTAASCAYTPMAVDPTPARWWREEQFVYLPRLQPYLESRRHPPFFWREMLALLAPRAFHYSYSLNDEVFPGGETVAEDMYKLGRLYDLLGARAKFVTDDTSPTHTYWPAARRGAYQLLDHTLRQGRE